MSESEMTWEDRVKAEEERYDFLFAEAERLEVHPDDDIFTSLKEARGYIGAAAGGQHAESRLDEAEAGIDKIKAERGWS